MAACRPPSATLTAAAAAAAQTCWVLALWANWKQTYGTRGCARARALSQQAQSKLSGLSILYNEVHLRSCQLFDTVSSHLPCNGLINHQFHPQCGTICSLATHRHPAVHCYPCSHHLIPWPGAHNKSCCLLHYSKTSVNNARTTTG
jgi:hypothetical protein